MATIGTGYLEQEEKADAIAEDAMERQAYEKHMDEELARVRSRLRVIDRHREILQRRHVELTGRRMEATWN